MPIISAIIRDFRSLKNKNDVELRDALTKIFATVIAEEQKKLAAKEADICPPPSEPVQDAQTTLETHVDVVANESTEQHNETQTGSENIKPVQSQNAE